MNRKKNTGSSKLQRFLLKIKSYHSVVGVAGATSFIFSRLTGTKPVVRTSVPGIKFPVYIRVGSTDLSVLQQVLIEQHYAFSLPLNPQVIIDAGANIGLSAVFFANQYPEALIVALEPDESNFLILQTNVAPYPLIKPIRAALWNQNK